MNFKCLVKSRRFSNIIHPNERVSVDLESLISSAKSTDNVCNKSYLTSLVMLNNFR